MAPMQGSAVAQIAAAQRADNARWITATIGVLTGVALLLVLGFRAPAGYAVMVGWAAVGQGFAYALARKGLSTAAGGLSCAFVFVEQVGSVAVGGQLGPMPYIIPIIVLLLAATSKARWLPVGFAACLAGLAIEARLSPWTSADQQAISTAALYTTIVFVVSLLHVRGTEHAFAIAEKQDQARESAAAVARDLETRLHTAERMEALGRLAGSVAHDFNNLLTVIQGASDLARGSLPTDHPARAELDAVVSAAGTAADLARQLLTFSRKQVVVRSRIDLSEVLTAQRDILARLVGPTVSLEYAFETGLPVILMPRAHAEQVAMNLAANARDAMPSGGRLQFRLRRRALTDREVVDLVAGTYVELQVDDEGSGISKETLPHLFEPLFTTKGQRGTGLGLATCLSIVAQAAGVIQVESGDGKGATFRVLLPAADGSEPAIRAPTPGRVKRVLVVDDDAAVLATTTRMLRAEGHDVVTASTVAQARAIVDDDATHLDAMITDVVLCDERGTDLVSQCRLARPRARIVVISGYAPDPGASETVAAHGAVFLPKPFGRDQLIRALRGEQRAEGTLAV
jgi:signal transduction histidine kinase/ActR/RegA family two-component response regulator